MSLCKFSIIGIGALGLWSWVPPAQADADTWATCGPFRGVSHIVQGSGSNNVQVGGQLSGMEGRTLLTHDPGRPDQPFDVVHEGGEGTWSLSQSDARVVATESEDGGVVLAAVYPTGVTETYNFLAGSLVYAQSGHDEGRVAISTYVADCTWSR